MQHRTLSRFQVYRFIFVLTACFMFLSFAPRAGASEDCLFEELENGGQSSNCRSNRQSNPPTTAKPTDDRLDNNRSSSKSRSKSYDEPEEDVQHRVSLTVSFSDTVLLIVGLNGEFRVNDKLGLSADVGTSSNLVLMALGGVYLQQIRRASALLSCWVIYTWYAGWRLTSSFSRKFS